MLRAVRFFALSIIPLIIFLVLAKPYTGSAHLPAPGCIGIELPLGDIPNDVSINRLAASEDGNPGFVAGTCVGVFYIGDIFQDGKIIIENDTIAIYDYYNDKAL
jgi:hypothetical protein